MATPLRPFFRLFGADAGASERPAKDAEGVVPKQGPVDQAQNGFALLESRKAAEAADVARTELSRSPRSAELLLLLGRSLAALGELTEARRTLLRGTVIAPDDWELNLELSQVMMNLDESDRAVRVLGRAMARGCDDDRVAELYARAHLAWEARKLRRWSLVSGQQSVAENEDEHSDS